MLSIGEMAHRSGVSRRMLRHWEQEGLLVPADIDPWSGYRRYQVSQLGRVRAIAELRDLGFGLEEIRQLLDPQIAQAGLEQLLALQASALQEQMVEASTRLAKIQHRLDVIHQKSEEITMNLSIEPLPALTLQGMSATVLDETEISYAVARLREHLSATDDDVVLLFDGTLDDRIVVSAGTTSAPATAGSGSEAPKTSLKELHAPAVEDGISVQFDAPPASVADAWVLIDAELEARQLTSGGVYRQIISPGGRTTLQAPIRHVR